MFYSDRDIQAAESSTGVKLRMTAGGERARASAWIFLTFALSICYQSVRVQQQVAVVCTAVAVGCAVKHAYYKSTVVQTSVKAPRLPVLQSLPPPPHLFLALVRERLATPIAEEKGMVISPPPSLQYIQYQIATTVTCTGASHILTQIFWYSNFKSLERCHS